MTQFVRNGGAGQDPCPRGCQFQGQWQPLDLATDVDDRRSLGCRHQVGSHASRGAHEQARRIEGFELLAVFVLRVRKSLERQQPFGGQVEPHAGGDDSLDMRARREQTFEHRRGFDDLLEVVEHQESTARAQRVDHLLQGFAFDP